MEHLSTAELQDLIRHRAHPSVSLFLPTHRHAPDTQQDPIRYGNLLRAVEADLVAQGMRTPDVSAFLAPARALLDDADFWRHQQDGLAVFFDAQEFHAYRLPISVEEREVVADRYFLSPLLPLFTGNGHFYILALSLNATRLFEATRFSVGEIDLSDDLHTSLEAREGEIDHERGLQGRSAGSGSAFHGHSVGGEVERMRIARYFNELDKGVRAALRDSRAPLVIASVEHLLPIYREVSEYAQVVEKGPAGNPEMLRAEELHAAAWPFVEERFRADVEAALARYGAQAGTGRTGLGLDEIVPAAVTGRVDTILLPPGLEIWGGYDDDALRVARSAVAPDDALELGGFAATQTLLNGGAVYGVERDQLPEGAEAIALYRY